MSLKWANNFRVRAARSGSTTPDQAFCGIGQCWSVLGVWGRPVKPSRAKIGQPRPTADRVRTGPAPRRVGRQNQPWPRNETQPTTQRPGSARLGGQCRGWGVRSCLFDPTNVNGGAIAIGHPLGVSGVGNMTTRVNALEQRGGRYGLQTICEGDGTANATIIGQLELIETPDGITRLGSGRGTSGRADGAATLASTWSQRTARANCRRFRLRHTTPPNRSASAT